MAPIIQKAKVQISSPKQSQKGISRLGIGIWFLGLNTESQVLHTRIAQREVLLPPSQ